MGAKETESLIEALRSLAEGRERFIPALGRSDIGYDLVRDLAEAGGYSDIGVLARKYGLSAEVLRVYVQLMDSQSEHWPVEYAEYEDGGRQLTLKAECGIVTEAFQSIGDEILSVPLPHGIEVQHHLLESEYYATEDILAMAGNSRSRTTLGRILSGFLQRFAHDSIGRESLLVEPYRRGNHQYVLRCSHWEMLILVHAGKRDADHNQVREAYESMVSQEREEMFVSQFFPVVLARGFTERARQSAATLHPDFLLLSFDVFLRLARFLDEDLDDTQRELAVWGLFQLAQRPTTESADPVALVRSFKRAVLDEVEMLLGESSLDDTDSEG